MPSLALDYPRREMWAKGTSGSLMCLHFGVLVLLFAINHGFEVVPGRMILAQFGQVELCSSLHL